MTLLSKREQSYVDSLLVYVHVIDKKRETIMLRHDDLWARPERRIWIYTGESGRYLNGVKLYREVGYNIYTEIA